MSAPATGLRTELLQLFHDGADSPLPDAEFEAFALRVFARNFETVPAYRAYCVARGRTPATVDAWTGIPAVPTAAFKELPLRDQTADVERVFRTSGTTRGKQRRGEHHVVDLEVYRASLRATFEAFLLPDGVRPRVVSLMPPADVLSDSSLAFMITEVMTAFGAAGSHAFADAGGLDFTALETALAAVEEGPVLLLGTSAAFLHWLDRLEETGARFVLPAGSRLMDTGGFKGRGRRVEPASLRAAYGQRIGIPEWACVNEYGMTELLSQYYDDTLRRRLRAGSPAAEWRPEGEIAGRTRREMTDSMAADPGRAVGGVVRYKRGPGWLRSVAVDPETLDPLPAGTTGLLRHVDLANLYGVIAVQTEDLGHVDGRGLVVEGRAAGAPTRGCSIAMDLLLSEAP